MVWYIEQKSFEMETYHSGTGTKRYPSMYPMQRVLGCTYYYALMGWCKNCPKHTELLLLLIPPSVLGFTVCNTTCVGFIGQSVCLGGNGFHM